MKIIDIDILSAFFYNENSKKRKGGFLWNPFYYPHAVLPTPQLCSRISRKMPMPTQYMKFLSMVDILFTQIGHIIHSQN